MQAYCLKCRDHRDISDAEQVKLKNGRPATRGKVLRLHGHGVQNWEGGLTPDRAISPRFD